MSKQAAKVKHTEREKLCKHFIDEIGSYMKPKDFQRPLFESISEQFEEGRTLTDKQITALKNMYERVTS